MSVSDAQKRATAKYEKEAYDKVLVSMLKGTKDRIKATEDHSSNMYMQYFDFGLFKESVRLVYHSVI